MELLSLASDSEVEDNGTFKVTDMSRPTPVLNEDGRSTVPLANPSSPSSGSNSTISSGGSVNTDVLSLSAPQGHDSPKFFSVAKQNNEVKFQWAGLAPVKMGPGPKCEGLLYWMVQNRWQKLKYFLILINCTLLISS